MTLTVVDLARHHRVAYLDEPTYLYHETTPDSLSKLAEHSLAAPEVWRRLSQRYSDTRYDVAVRHRYGRMCHDGAWECARRGRLREAWQFHRESLRAPGGATFLLFSVKLLYATVRRLFSAG